METGRFISRDPLSAMPGWVEHPYMYASANPVNLVDPLGLCSWRKPHDCVKTGVEKAGEGIDKAWGGIKGGAEWLWDLVDEHMDKGDWLAVASFALGAAAVASCLTGQIYLCAGSVAALAAIVHERSKIWTNVTMVANMATGNTCAGKQR